MCYIAIITGKYVGPCIDCDKISFSGNRRKIYEKISKKYIFQKKIPLHVGKFLSFGGIIYGLFHFKF